MKSSITYRSSEKPPIPIYADEIEKAYDEVKESFNTAVAYKLSDYEVHFKNGPRTIAILTKAGLKWSGKRGQFDELFKEESS